MNHYENILATLNLLTGAYAENTLKSYYADANAFVDWCSEENVEPFPLTSASIRRYIEAMAMSYSYASIRRRLSDNSFAASKSVKTPFSLDNLPTNKNLFCRFE